MNIRMSLDEVPLTQCVKTSRKTLLPRLSKKAYLEVWILHVPRFFSLPYWVRLI